MKSRSPRLRGCCVGCTSHERTGMKKQGLLLANSIIVLMVLLGVWQA